MVQHRSDLQVRDKVVVITGASSGIGQATAELFARNGARLVLAARDEAALQTVVEGCRQMGGQAVAVPVDVTDAERVERLADAALAKHGQIDVWIANVGVGAVGLFHEVPLTAHARVLRTNLLGRLNEAHAVLPVFLKQGRGIFINMISVGGFSAVPYAAAYSASKFGLRGFSEALRGELMNHPHIHVCDVYPSFVDTPGIGHGANYTGRKLTVPPPILDARRVAQAILRLTLRPRPTTMLGVPTVALRLIHAISPQVTVNATGRVLRRYFARAQPIPRSNGNIFHPPAKPGGIDGGLRSTGPSVLVTAGVMMLSLGTLALILSARRDGGSRRDHRRSR